MAGMTVEVPVQSVRARSKEMRQAAVAKYRAVAVVQSIEETNHGA
jgi:hypothetical protein